MSKKIITLKEIRSALDRKHLPDLWARAQRAFEKQSGWNRKQIQSTLKEFSRLNGVNKAFFGGLLIGQAFIPGSGSVAASKAPAKTATKTVGPKVAPKARRKSTASRASRAH